MKIIKFLAVTLALIAVIVTLGCSGGKDPRHVTDTFSSDTGDPFEALPHETFDGYGFNVLIRNLQTCINDMFQEEQTDDKVQSAVYNRNKRVENRLNIKLVCTAKDDGFTELDSIFAGDDDYDLILPHARYCALYTAGGYLYDWNLIQTINLDGEWWDQNCRKSLSINKKLMYMTGDISYWSYGATNLLLFNKDLFDENGLEYPYQAVRNNSWTIDDFETLIRKGKKDLNGDGKMTVSDDQFGYMTMGFIGDVQAYHATGNTVVNKDADDTPYISYYTKRAESVWTWYKNLIYSDCCYFQDSLVNYMTTDAVIGFREGRSLFTDINTVNVPLMRSMDDEFGIIPWPTYLEGEKFLTNVDAGMHLFCIPLSAKNVNRTGLILEALCIAGHQDVIPEYYEVTVKSRDTRDDESYEMLDIIFRGRVYDLGYYNVQLTGSVGANEAIANNFKYLTENKVGSMAVAWSKYGKMAQERMDDYLDTLAGLG
ncbi:MAG: extracellular solute-binding protein [Clostridia bacterium]|nr:extracellular solute-binding protein [Clostridia bacterium]